MYSLVAIGGTFDHLHRGHEAFLCAAFSRGKRVLIGLTSDEMAGQKIQISKFKIQSKFQIQNFKIRKQKLLELLREKKWIDRVEIVRIDDLYGPTLERDDIEALVVTTETEGGARMINAARKKKKLSIIPVIVAKLMLAQDRRRIASTRIREGNIDRIGLLYRKFPIFGGKIPEAVRQQLKKPMGQVETQNLASLRRRLQNASFIITVGDVVTKYMNQIDSRIVDIAIVDFRVNRKEIHTSLADVGFTHEKMRNYIVTSVKNPPGYISKTVVRAVHQAIERRLLEGKRSIIRVIGEEDLAGVPAILLAPLGSIVLYGQPPSAAFMRTERSHSGARPGEGMVSVEVTEEKKEEIRALLVIGNRQ